MLCSFLCADEGVFFSAIEQCNGLFSRIFMALP